MVIRSDASGRNKKHKLENSQNCQGRHERELRWKIPGEFVVIKKAANMRERESFTELLLLLYIKYG